MTTPSFPPTNVICAGVVVVANARCLFVEEAQGRLAGQWGIPWGYVEEGEAPDEAASREAMEEAGVSVRVTSLLGTASLSNPAGAVGLVFLGELDPPDQKPRGDGAETRAARFFSRAEMDREGVRFEPWCRWVAQRVLAGHTGVARALDGPSPLPTFL